MKKILISLLLVLVIAFPAFGESAKKQVHRLEQRVAALEEAWNMVLARIEGGIDFPMDAGLPAVGEAKFVMGEPLDLHHCDAIDDGTAVWSIHSGAGVTIALDPSIMNEGTGSIKVTVPGGVTAIVKATKSSGAWDLSAYESLKASLRRSDNSSMIWFYLRFGESAYNEQSHTVTTPPPANTWVKQTWDISGIASGSRDGVTIFSVQATNSSGVSKSFWIDYVFAEPGPSEFVGNDGNMLIRFFPKAHFGSYTGDGQSSKTITLDRKGTPALVFIQCVGGSGRRPRYRTASMGAGNCLDWSTSTGYITDGITAFGDGTFTVGNGAEVNNSGDTYHYFVLWDDLRPE